MSLFNLFKKNRKLIGSECFVCGHLLTEKDLTTALKPNILQCPKCETQIEKIRLTNGETELKVKINKEFGNRSRKIMVYEAGGLKRIEKNWANPNEKYYVLLLVPIVLLASYWITKTYPNDEFSTSQQFWKTSFQIGYLLILLIPRLLNVSKIIVEGDKLTFGTTPLSIFRRMRSFHKDQIVNISISRVTLSSENGRTSYHCRLFLELKNGKAYNLFPVKDVSEAIFVEKLVEKWLGIADNPNLDTIEP